MKEIDRLLISVGFFQGEKEVACNYSAMHILRFYFVGQHWHSVLVLFKVPALAHTLSMLSQPNQTLIP